MKRRKFDFFNNQFPALSSFMLFGGYFHILSLPREPVLFAPAYIPPNYTHPGPIMTLVKF
jgi:hypothetical protein